jgi:hypothetical protein
MPARHPRAALVDMSLQLQPKQLSSTPLGLPLDTRQPRTHRHL